MAGLTFDVTGDVSKITRHVDGLAKKAIPRASVAAVNAVVKKAYTEGIREASKDLRLPQKLIRDRFDQHGAFKGRRIQVFKAKVRGGSRTALVRFYNRGIPVTQITNKAQGKAPKGIKAKGGRFYRGAFEIRVRLTGQRLVVKRSTWNSTRVGGARWSGPGKTRDDEPLFVPKVGIRKRVGKILERKTIGNEGRTAFRFEFERRARVEAARVRS